MKKVVFTEDTSAENRIREFLTNLRLKFEVLNDVDNDGKTLQIIIHGTFDLLLFSKFCKLLAQLGFKSPKMWGDKGEIIIEVSK